VNEKERGSSRPVANLVRTDGEGDDGGEIPDAGGLVLPEYGKQVDGICRARLTTC
jgi:hypothetical protein